ncbi:hypothetical protein GCG54_00014137 [Colletotrichum gloeosporioides]|uniref:Uncharacterized protein n=1 Tax=Colletotrichum gloeosporioides TaxID=474922 RepID=A0A8H4CTL4_COLGL|nr:uncharacterized protein GCG54_00014137 [Colletotrichum gloeosporioides]KAF3809923.1 hypothetical protein GCG54_00014137 [Colletotrichum gloeosporioides]
MEYFLSHVFPSVRPRWICPWSLAPATVGILARQVDKPSVRRFPVAKLARVQGAHPVSAEQLPSTFAQYLPRFSTSSQALAEPSRVVLSTPDSLRHPATPFWLQYPTYLLECSSGATQLTGNPTGAGSVAWLSPGTKVFMSHDIHPEANMHSTSWPSRCPQTETP